jgi:tetratricopeptide (TPR) repeat protein
MNLRPSIARMRQLTPLSLMLFSAAVAAAAYLQALHFPFISDDTVYITENTKLLGLHFSELWRLFIEPYNRYEFLPLRDLSYWFDITLFGLNPAAFRLHNIILYLLCLPLVYATTLGLWRYFRPADTTAVPWAAASVTALFALHPAHVEAVVWISGRKDVLSGLFSLLALWFAVNAKRERGLSARYAAAALLALLAAMLSKATAVAVAPVIAMLWFMFWRDIPEQSRGRSQLLWPFASLLLAACLTMIFMANSSVKEPVYFGIESVTRMLAVLGWMARLAVTPESRHFFHPVLEDTKLAAMVAFGVIILMASVAAVVMELRKRFLAGFALAMFLLLCFPYFQLIPYLTNSLVTDRFLFLAVFPVLLLVVALAWQLNPVPRAILLLAIVLPWGYQTAERPRDWRDFEPLIDTELRAYPGYYQPAYQKIWIQLGSGLYSDAIATAGTITVPEFRNIMMAMIRASYAVNTATTGKPDEALAVLQNFEIALNHLPAQSKWNTTMLQVRSGGLYILSLKGARLAKQFPEDALVQYRAGLWKLDVHYYEDAVTHLRAATGSQRLPESLRGTAFKNLGIALLDSGHADQAEAPLRAALEQSPPDLSAYCALSTLYKQANRLGEAVSAERECRQRVPGAGSVR